jgi:hypothetical protein
MRVYNLVQAAGHHVKGSGKERNNHRRGQQRRPGNQQAEMKEKKGSKTGRRK